MLDCLHAMEVPWVFGLFYLPLTLWIAAGRKRIYRQPQFVVLYGNTDCIWKEWYLSGIRTAFLCGGLYSSIVCLLSAMVSVSVNNWGQKGSLFYVLNGTVYQGESSTVMLSFFLGNILKTALVIYGIGLLEECTHEMVYSYLVLAALIVWEWVFPEQKLFFNLFSISHRNCRTPERMMVSLLVGIAVTIAVFWIGKALWRKKEFYEA